MRLRAEVMLKIDELMSALPVEDQEMVAFEVFRTYGNTKNTSVKTRKTRVGQTVLTPVFPLVSNGLGGTLGGVVLASSKKRDASKDREALEILEFLNQKAGRSYRPVEENLRFIRARLNTSTAQDIKGVIARKTREWLNTEYAKYLRPATLFNATKFESYLGEQARA